jgi:exosortase
MTLSKRNVLFSAYCLCLILIHLGVLRLLFDFSMENDTASHLVLVPFVTLALIYWDRRSIFSSVRWTGLGGLGLLLAGVGLFVAARMYSPSGGQDDTLTWMVGAMIVLVIGGFLLFYGRDAFRAALFPLLFLGFMIPIPSALLDGMIGFLKGGSAEAVAGFFTLTGTPYHREGFIFTLPDFAIEIADECSGIRSSIALLLTGLLAGHVSLNRTWAKALLVMAILPMMIVKNGIRITGLCLLAMHVDPGFLTGQLHHDGGIVFFLLALALLAPILFLLRRWEMGQPSHLVNSSPERE